MQKKHKLFAALAAAVLAVLPMNGTLTASAATPEDVLAALSSKGWPDWMVQQAANQLGGGSFTSDQCDKMISQISEYDAELEKQIGEILGIPTTTSPAQSDQNSTTTTTTVTAAAQEQEQIPNQSRPADKSFLQMTLEEKKAYLGSLTEAERQAFLKHLTPEERNSIIKQMSTSDQAELIAGFLDIAGEFGLSFQIGELTGDNISVSAYDENGNLVNVSSMSMTVDPTGIPYTLPIAAAAGLILVSAGGMYFLIRRNHA